MKALIASALALGLMAATTSVATARPAVGIRIGNVGIGVGHYHWHHHWYHHRHWERDHFRYW